MTDTAPTREALLAALTEQRGRLERWIAARTPEEMERPVTPSEIPGGAMWRVKDHLAHALGVERYLQGAVKRTLAGADDPAGFYTEAGSLTHEAVARVANASNERALAKYRDEPVAALLVRLGETRQATLALLASLSDEQLDQESPHSPFPPGTVRGLFKQMARHDGQHVDWLTEALARS
ncbi:MAG TPA: DinB family protein [Ktedonobacterales bacterium]|nr:DinB family protein [Ktedonobacterales bacterium]